MSEEKPLYASKEQDIASPGFAQFCRKFRGATVQELYVRADGTGIYLKAGNRSTDLIYKPRSFSRASVGRIDAPAGQLNLFPEGKETEIQEYLPADVIEEAKIAVERPDVITGLLSSLYAGREIEEAFLETRRGPMLNARGFRTPDDTPFFFPSPLPIRFTDDEIVFFMEPHTFLRAVCEDGSTKTVYIPTEADR
ncbi:MAG: hypothetical protein HY516_01150 [Candidatus Aenigmarchaeota archaeon]|nr:hypothetical protein [Candidatus Aenigmarchaeota archaeon]